MGKSLEGLHPFVKAKAEQLLVNANGRLKKYKMVITQGLRTKDQQDALYAQGRTKPGPKVTNARGGYSMHNYGLAIDFALVSPDGQKIVWDMKSDFDGDKKADWMEVVEEAKKLGFEWGGDWRSFKDYPHFQMTAGLSDHEVYSGIKPKFPALVEINEGQEGLLHILKPISVWKREKGELKKVKGVVPGQKFKVYGFDDKWGGQYSVGGGLYITNMKGYVRYEKLK